MLEENIFFSPETTPCRISSGADAPAETPIVLIPLNQSLINSSSDSILRAFTPFALATSTKRTEFELFGAPTTITRSTSLLNALTKQNIAQVSKQAGKTRKINFFFSHVLKKIIVDLPGYGFAKRTAKERQLWAELIQAYVTACAAYQIRRHV